MSSGANFMQKDPVKGVLQNRNHPNHAKNGLVMDYYKGSNLWNSAARQANSTAATALTPFTLGMDAISSSPSSFHFTKNMWSAVH